MEKNCRNCKHFFISFDPKAPNGCRIFNFKSKKMPFIVVSETNKGQECAGFTPKNKLPKRKNLNDPSLW